MNLREIAKEADVSLTTVSLVLNGKPGISSETRERVKDLLHQNGYDVKGKSKSSRSICFLKYLRHAHLVNGNPGFVTQIMDAVERWEPRVRVTDVTFQADQHGKLHTKVVIAWTTS